MVHPRLSTLAGVSNLLASLGHTLNTTWRVITQKSHHVFSKFTILCWVTFTAILGCMRPTGHRLDTPSIFFFISFSVTFISFWVFFILLSHSASALSILITSVLNSASDSWLSPFCLGFFQGFCSVLSFGPYFFVSSIWQPPCICFSVLGRAALTPCLSSMAYCRKHTCTLCGTEP